MTILFLNEVKIFHIFMYHIYFPFRGMPLPSISLIDIIIHGHQSTHMYLLTSLMFYLSFIFLYKKLKYFCLIYIYDIYIHHTYSYIHIYHIYIVYNTTDYYWYVEMQ